MHSLTIFETGIGNKFAKICDLFGRVEKVVFPGCTLLLSRATHGPSGSGGPHYPAPNGVLRKNRMWTQEGVVAVFGTRLTLDFYTKLKPGRG